MGASLEMCTGDIAVDMGVIHWLCHRCDDTTEQSIWKGTQKLAWPEATVKEDNSSLSVFQAMGGCVPWISIGRLSQLMHGATHRQV
eukprot:6492152-Amphidinium_carterae.5